MNRVFLAVCLLHFMGALLVKAQPSEREVALDAASFHRFRLAALAQANEMDKQSPNSNAGAKYLGGECGKLARRTSADYLYGIVTDLMQDTSRTEEPSLLAIMILDNYPPDQAHRVVREIIDDPRYAACSDVKNWPWEIDEAQKDRGK